MNACVFIVMLADQFPVSINDLVVLTSTPEQGLAPIGFVGLKGGSKDQGSFNLFINLCNSLGGRHAQLSCVGTGLGMLSI